MTNNIWSSLRKNKSNTLSIPTKPTKTATIKSIPNTATTASTTKPAKQKHVKVKSHKAKAQVQKVQQTQKQPQYDLSDFSLSTNADANNIHITTMYQGWAIHVFSLPSIEYANWQRAKYQQKYAYVLSKTDLIAFNNDFRIIQPVIINTVQILDAKFARAKAQMAQQAQMAQRGI